MESVLNKKNLQYRDNFYEHNERQIANDKKVYYKNYYAKLISK